jgi:hypothetical protein
MTSQTFIYVVESITGVVKIGCSYNPEERAKRIAAESCAPARLIAKWPGVIPEEIALHKRFIEHHSHNEWFHLRGDVAAFIEPRRGLGVVVSTWAEVTAPRTNGRRSRGRGAIKSRLDQLRAAAEARS